MEIRVFEAGILLFLFLLAVHVVIWRIKTLRKGTLILMIILFVGPLLALIPPVSEMFLFAVLGTEEKLAAILLNYALSLVYFSSYPAVRAVSPSLDILLILSEASNGKLTESEIVNSYKDRNLVADKVDALCEYGLIRGKNGSFWLSGFAKIIILVFIGYRRLLGLAAGRG